MSFYYVPQKTFNYELLVVILLDELKLESWASLFKTNMLYNGLKSWKRMAKSATIWSTCGCLYQVLKCSLWAYLSLWSLPNLLCAKFWDLLKMNVALTFCLSWRANSIIISSPILMCVRMFSQDFYNLESFP
jgi:hypothetical protein